MWRNNRGSIVGGAYWLAVGVLLAASAAAAVGAVADVQATDRRSLNLQAGQLAEAGLDYAVKYLGDDQVNWMAWPARGDNTVTQSYGNGRFTVTVQPVTSQAIRDVRAVGEVVRDGTAVGSWALCGHARRWIPSDFYDHTIISSLNITLDGSIVVTGGELNVDSTLTGRGLLYGESLITNGTAVVVTDPSPTKDPSINPLPLLDLDWLRAKARSQGNYYDADRLAAVTQGTDRFPRLFYYELPTIDLVSGRILTPGVPNVVFVEGDLTVAGTTVIGGFFVVANAADVGSRGNTVLDGIIYALGDVAVTGNTAVTGAVWSGGHVTVAGDAAVTYNGLFTDAIERLYAPPAVQLLGYHRCE